MSIFHFFFFFFFFFDILQNKKYILRSKQANIAEFGGNMGGVVIHLDLQRLKCVCMYVLKSL